MLPQAGPLDCRIAPDRRHVHDHRAALVALVEPERRGLAGPAPARGGEVNRGRIIMEGDMRADDGPGAGLRGTAIRAARGSDGRPGSRGLVWAGRRVGRARPGTGPEVAPRPGPAVLPHEPACCLD